MGGEKKIKEKKMFQRKDNNFLMLNEKQKNWF